MAHTQHMGSSDMRHPHHTLRRPRLVSNTAGLTTASARMLASGLPSAYALGISSSTWADSKLASVPQRATRMPKVFWTRRPAPVAHCSSRCMVRPDSSLRSEHEVSSGMHFSENISFLRLRCPCSNSRCVFSGLSLPAQGIKELHAHTTFRAVQLLELTSIVSSVQLL